MADDEIQPDEPEDFRGDDPSKTWGAIPPSLRSQREQHPAHEGRLIGPHGNFQPQHEYSPQEVAAAVERLRQRKRDRGEEPDF